VRSAIAAFIAFLAITNCGAYSQTSGGYRVIPDALKLPDGRTWGATSSIFIDSKGNIWTFDRCGGEDCLKSKLDPILEYDSSGKFIKSFGAGLFALPHGLYVDKEGNVWVADGGMGAGPSSKESRDAAVAEGEKAHKGQQVIKFSPDGKVLMTLGKAGVGGDGPDTFHFPTGIVVAPNGDIFVSDGHGEITWGPGESNARIVKFTKDGKFIKAWGTTGSAVGDFSTPHAIALDSAGRLFVVDRGNRRIQIFDQDGKFLDAWYQFGRPSGLFIGPNDEMYVCGDQKRPTLQGTSLLDPGIRIGSAKDGEVKTFIPAIVGSDGKPNVYEGCSGDGKGHVYGAGSHPYTGITEWVKDQGSTGGAPAR
jgi:DNA-binding beta-propeller fold protein YncE